MANSLTLVTATFDPLGIALDPLLCTANHSCDPNAVVVFNGSSASFRSLRRMAKHEEIFISYVDGTNPFTLRQAELKDRYAFVCACSKCQLGGSQCEDAFSKPASQLSSGLPRSGLHAYEQRDFASNPAFAVGETIEEKRLSGLQGSVFRALESARNDKDSHAAGQKCEEIMRICHDSGLWPLTRQPYAAARDELFARMCADGKPSIALGHGIRRHFSIDPVLYEQDFHPVRVVHAWALVKVLMWLYGRPEDPQTQAMLRAGFDFVVPIWRLLRTLRLLVRKSHGEDSRFASEVEEMAEEIRGEMLRSGPDSVNLIERDPGDHWKTFEAWKDAPIY